MRSGDVATGSTPAEPDPTPASVESAAWDDRYAGAGLVWTAEPNQFLASEVAEIPPGRALDLACGEGRNSVWLASRGWAVTGVDFSPVGLDKACRVAELQGVEVDWVTADVITYQPLSGTFDLVVVAYLHLPATDLASVLGHAEAALAPDGTLLVIGHDTTNLTDGHGGPQDPAVLYGPDQVVAALHDLTIDRAERVRRPVATGDRMVEAIDVLVRAHRVGGNRLLPPPR